MASAYKTSRKLIPPARRPEDAPPPPAELYVEPENDIELLGEMLHDNRVMAEMLQELPFDRVHYRANLRIVLGAAVRMRERCARLLGEQETAADIEGAVDRLAEAIAEQLDLPEDDLMSDTNAAECRAYYRTPRGRATHLVQVSRRNGGGELVHTLQVDRVEKAIEGGVCELTGLPFNLQDRWNPFAPSLDRRDPQVGYTDENVQIVVWAYNAAKGSGNHEDVRRFAAAVMASSLPAAPPAVETIIDKPAEELPALVYFDRKKPYTDAAPSAAEPHPGRKNGRPTPKTGRAFTEVESRCLEELKKGPTSSHALATAIGGVHKRTYVALTELRQAGLVKHVRVDGENVNALAAAG